MSSSRRLLIFRAVCLGLGGGLRSLSPLGALSLAFNKSGDKRKWKHWAVLRSAPGRRVLIALAALEYVADKAPWAQPRIALGFQPSTGDPGLIARVALTSVGGAALGTEHGGRDAVVMGAAFAMVGSILGNYAGYYAREALNSESRWPDPVLALVEDAVAIGLISLAVHDRDQ